MDNYAVYKLNDFINETFPFRIERRNRITLNRALHAHDNFQICYINKGACQHLFNGNLYILSKGDMFSIPPYEKHQLHIYDDHEVEMIQIDFLPSFINENMQELSSMEGFTDFLYIQPLLAENYGLLPKLNISPKQAVRMEALIESMFWEIENREEGYQLSLKADLLKLLVIIGREFRSYASRKEEREAIRHYKDRFQEIVQYIENNYNRDITLEEVAHKASVSPAYFSHMFKMVKGCSVVDYINQTRIQHALELLKTSELNITDICFQVGFNHVGHFNRMFKRFVGSTPSKYKISQKEIVT